MREEVYRHFSPQERPFLARVEDWIRMVQVQKKTVRTDFLDPRQVYILKSLTGGITDIAVHLDGGYQEAERTRGLLYPSFFVEPPEDPGLALLGVQVTDSQALSHRDYLGALTHLGLKREKIGDLWLTTQGCQVVVAEEIADWILMQLERVGRYPARTRLLPWEELQPPFVQMEERVITVASPRLDAVVAELAHLSRARAVEMLREQKVKVNYQTLAAPDRELHEGDLLTLRGYGRFRLLEVLGVTRKGRLRLKFGKFS